MILSEAIAGLKLADNLPRDAMQWSLDHWDEAAPPLLDMLRDYASGADRSDEATIALFFAIHLIGGYGETRAFADLCRLLHDGEASQNVLGDAITENLSGILIRTFDGDVSRLQALIDDQATDDFIRHAALMAMGYLTRTGRIDDAAMRDHLSRRLASIEPEIDDVLFWAYATAVACLAYDEFVPRVEALFRRCEADYPMIDLKDFHQILVMSRADPDGMAGFANDHVEPLTDPIGVLSQWSGFSGEEPAYTDDEAPWPEIQAEPLVNPFRHVGRNDLCPCGSGKKFKKCCLPLSR